MHAATLKSFVIAFAIICLISPAMAADLTGTAQFDGPVPKRNPISLVDHKGKPSDCHALHKDGILNENLIVGESGGLANVFVYVKKGLIKRKYSAPEKAAVLDQEQCMFHPRVQGVMVGQEVLMRNSDPIIHNVRSLSVKNRAFNIAQPAETPDRSKLFTKGEREINIRCDFHPWMAAYIFVMDHPYFAVTDESGKFKITGLPAGDYTLEAWHEELGDQEFKVSVAADVVATAAFTFKPSASGIAAKTTSTVASHAGHHSHDQIPMKKKRKFVKMWTVEDFVADIAALGTGSIEQGKAIFTEASCIKCHVVAGKGTKLGPDLTDVTKRFKGAKLLEQLLKPSAEIHKEFQTQVFVTDDGNITTGLVIKETDEIVHLLANPLKPDEITEINKTEIESRSNSQLSTMPEGLLMTYKKEEILDLVAYLQAEKK